LYLASYGPVEKSALIDYMMESGEYGSRANCVRVVNRLLEQMTEEGCVKADEDGSLSLQRRFMVGEYPGPWLALGLGASITFFGLGYMENDNLLILCALSFLIYSAAVVLHNLTRLSPF